MSSFITLSTKKQAEAYKYLDDTDTLFLCFGGGAGGGKSWLGCEWILSICLVFPNVRYFIGRKNLKSLKESTLITFWKVCDHYKINRKRINYNSISGILTFDNGSTISLLNLQYMPSDPDFTELGSTEYTGGFLEEAGQINFAAFDTLKSRVGRHMNKEYGIPPKIFITCNPKKNWLYTTFYKPWREGTLPEGYKFVQSLYSDNKHTAKEYETMLLSITDTVKRQRLMLGLWEYESSEYALHEYEDIENLFSNIWVSSGKGYITVDVARKGKDETVIGVWSGLRLTEIIVLAQCLTPDIVNKIKELRLKYKIPLSNIIADEDGVGGGTVDYARCLGFLNGSKPIGKNKNYANLKTQCAFKLAELLPQMYVAATVEQREEIKAELEIVREIDTDNDTGKVKVITRKEMVGILGRSPDYWSMLLMRMYWEVKPRIKAQIVRI